MNEREAPCPLTIKFFVLNFFSTNYIVIGLDISRRIDTSTYYYTRARPFSAYYNVFNTRIIYYYNIILCTVLTLV